MWMVIPSEYYRSDSVDGNYYCSAAGLTTTFRPSRLLGVLFLCRDYHDYHDFRDFWTNIALVQARLHKKETKIALKLDKNCYLLKFPCKNMEIIGSAEKPLRGAESLGVHLPLNGYKTPKKGKNGLLRGYEKSPANGRRA